MEPYLAVISVALCLLVLLGLLQLNLAMRLSREMQRIFSALAETGESLKGSLEAVGKLATNLNGKAEQGGAVITSLQETAEVLLDTAEEARAVVTPLIRQLGEFGEKRNTDAGRQQDPLTERPQPNRP
ncbi:MAG: hypothetical protein AB1568_04930 [Thermodesulfobacteriota bacterium]